jgi:hypothetical protein
METTTGKQYKTIEVRDLQIGMVLTWTNELVIDRPISYIKTPSGKLQLSLRKNDRTRLAVWNRHTLIAVNL